MASIFDSCRTLLPRGFQYHEEPTSLRSAHHCIRYVKYVQAWGLGAYNIETALYVQENLDKIDLPMRCWSHPGSGSMVLSHQHTRSDLVDAVRETAKCPGLSMSSWGRRIATRSEGSLISNCTVHTMTPSSPARLLLTPVDIAELVGFSNAGSDSCKRHATSRKPVSLYLSATRIRTHAFSHRRDWRLAVWLGLSHAR